MWGRGCFLHFVFISFWFNIEQRERSGASRKDNPTISALVHPWRSAKRRLCEHWSARHIHDHRLLTLSLTGKVLTPTFLLARRLKKSRLKIKKKRPEQHALYRQRKSAHRRWRGFAKFGDSRGLVRMPRLAKGRQERGGERWRRRGLKVFSYGKFGPVTRQEKRRTTKEVVGGCGRGGRSRSTPCCGFSYCTSRP